MRAALRYVLLSCILAGAFGRMGCHGLGPINECNDGADNDGDGLIDWLDSGCSPACTGNDRPDSERLPVCGDCIDNDGDGLIDGDDPGCAGASGTTEFDEPRPACGNGLDDDGDGLIDYPDEPGCLFPVDNDESDSCPGGPGCPACGNGLDDDGDGKADFPADVGCQSAAYIEEYDLLGPICGGLLVRAFPDIREGSGQAAGAIERDGASGFFSPVCGGDGTENVWAIDVGQPSTLVVTTDFAETEVDTVVYLRRDCVNAATELACNDNAGSQTLHSEFAVEISRPGRHYLVVDGARSASGGRYRVEVASYAPLGGPCELTCAPGQTCRPLDSSTEQEACWPPVCSDQHDNDGDGLIDFPFEPGCQSLEDSSEEDNCAGGSGCPTCSNGTDDDGDGTADFPADIGCRSAGDDSEVDECVAGVPLHAIDPAGVTGTTPPSGSGSFFSGSCSSAPRPEDVYAFPLLRSLSSLTFSTQGSAGDTITYVRFADCADDGAEVGCENVPGGGERVTVLDPPAGLYYAFVDSGLAAGISYVLRVSGTIAPAQPCDPGDAVFRCEHGYICDEFRRICAPPPPGQ
ncbi:MAG: hypothetical protein MJE77_05045 [Proteobacteria bacterium]|nr:hypothetical protein [Pseudomonadota bacterium]